MSRARGAGTASQSHRGALVAVAVALVGLAIFLSYWFGFRKKDSKENQRASAGSDNVGVPPGGGPNSQFPRAPFPASAKPGAQLYDNQAGHGPPPSYYEPKSAAADAGPENAPHRVRSFESGQTKQGIPTLKKIPEEPQDLPPGYASHAASPHAMSASTPGNTHGASRAVGTNGQVYAVKQGRTCAAFHQHSMIDTVLDSCEAYCGHDNQCIGFSYNYANGSCYTYADCPDLKAASDDSRVFVKMPSRNR